VQREYNGILGENMEIALIALSIISISFFIGLVVSIKKLKVVSEGFSQLFLTYNALRDVLDLKEEAYKTEDDIHKENFIKFLSDSREWAFTYIEEVQNGLKKFISEVEPDIVYYDNFGSVVEGMVAPHDKALKKISKEFQELKKLLPEELNDRR
jgi:hypothetical protein